MKLSIIQVILYIQTSRLINYHWWFSLTEYSGDNDAETTVGAEGVTGNTVVFRFNKNSSLSEA